MLLFAALGIKVPIISRDALKYGEAHASVMGGMMRYDTGLLSHYNHYNIAKYNL